MEKKTLINVEENITECFNECLKTLVKKFLRGILQKEPLKTLESVSQTTLAD